VKLYRVGVIAGLLASAVTLAACSSSKSSSGNTNTSSGGGSSTTSAAGAPTCSSGKLTAEGSTAQTNAINKWIQDYQNACSGSTITYNPTGSGAGVTAFNANQGRLRRIGLGAVGRQG